MPHAARIACAVLALATATPAAAAVRYVATTGNDGAAGTSAQPWRTLHRAAPQLKAGDQLIIRAGDYRESLQIGVSGAPGKPILITGQGLPRIIGDDDGVAISGAWLEVTGLDARAQGLGSAIHLMKGAHHVRVANTVAHDAGCAGIGAEGTDHILIEDNQVYGNARRAVWQCSGISIYQPVAVDDAPGFHNVIRRNRSWDNMNVVVDENVSHSGGRTTDGNGIIIDDFEHSQSPGTPYRYGTLVEGNTVFDNGGRGVHVYVSRNVVVVGNVAWHNLKDPKLWRPAAELSAVRAGGVTLINNIAVPRGSDPAANDSEALGFNLWDANLTTGSTPWKAWRTYSRPGGRTISGRDPLFVRPSTDPKVADFRLQSASPAKGKGAAVYLEKQTLVQVLGGTRGDMGTGYTRLP